MSDRSKIKSVVFKQKLVFLTKNKSYFKIAYFCLDSQFALRKY